MERQVEITISHKDTYTGVDLSIVWLRILIQYEEGVQYRHLDGGVCGVGGLLSMEGKWARCTVASALSF